MWLPCPLHTKAHRLPLAFSHVAGSKTRVIHWKARSSHIHPLEVPTQFHMLSIPEGTHAFEKFSPLKMIVGGIALPSAQMHSTTVIHSLLPASVLYTVFSFALQIT